MALGADAGDLLKMVVRQGMTLTGLGVLAGVLAALALTQLLTSLLFSVSTTDPLTFAAVALLFMGVAFLSSYVPARRATRVDPMVALHYE